MNLTTSLILLISIALVHALPTKEQIDGTFMFIGSQGKIVVDLIMKC